jgi:hypothetical protein
VRFARFAGGTSVGFWLIFGEIEMANIMTEAVSTPDGFVVEQVAAKGRISGESHEQKGEKV